MKPAKAKARADDDRPVSAGARGDIAPDPELAAVSWPHPSSFKVISPEPDGTPCAQCGCTGRVYLIRDPFRAVASEALHEQCAPIWFRRQPPEPGK